MVHGWLGLCVGLESSGVAILPPLGLPRVGFTGYSGGKLLPGNAHNRGGHLVQFGRCAAVKVCIRRLVGCRDVCQGDDMCAWQFLPRLGVVVHWCSSDPLLGER